MQLIRDHHLDFRVARRRIELRRTFRRIGHLKAEHRMGRNYLAHRAGDAVNAVLAAAGYNFHLLLRWLELLLSKFLGGSESSGRPSMGLKIENFTDDYSRLLNEEISLSYSVSAGSDP